MKPHKHAEIIKAWADGVEIEIRYPGEQWFKSSNPTWDDKLEYRIKPVEPEKVYPRTRMTREELSDAWNLGPDESFIRTVESVVNAALRHACDNGQVVTRKEFDLAVGDRSKRDLAVARAVNHVIAESRGLPDEHLLGIINGVKP